MHPQILTLNLPSTSVKALTDINMTVTEGSQGDQIRIAPQYNYGIDCLLNHKYPPNFHEHDIVIIDLANSKIRDYEANEHILYNNKSKSTTCIRCFAPQKIFDPRPLSLSFLTAKIDNAERKPFLLLTFCSHKEELEYHIVRSGFDESVERASNYSFLSRGPSNRNKEGKKTIIIDRRDEISKFLLKYSAEYRYEIIFDHPTLWTNDQYINDPKFVPLITNADGEIVSYIYQLESGACSFFFPIVKNQADFLKQFLQEIAPSFVPALFPNNSKNSWLSSKLYQLPGHANLVEEQENLLKKQEKERKGMEMAIEENNKKHLWLHELLTQNDDQLVKAVMTFLSWLEFSDVQNSDDHRQSAVKEEDIHIETDSGLLLFEIKGLGGTSQDSDCAQVGKIRSRRIENLKRFDVFGIYIVNHQRHIPAYERKHPPFTDHQLKDASYEKRGLVTTWQLYNLYFQIESGVLSKDQVRASFLEYGLIDFIPKDYILLGAPTEVLKNNLVVILTLEADITLSVGDELFAVHNSNFSKFKIQSLQVNNSDATVAVGVETGILLSRPIQKGTILYKIV